jgi:hypothetical protein
LRSDLRCQRCANVSSVREPFIDISLEFPRASVSPPTQPNHLQNVSGSNAANTNASASSAPNLISSPIPASHSQSVLGRSLSDSASGIGGDDDSVELLTCLRR